MQLVHIEIGVVSSFVVLPLLSGRCGCTVIVSLLPSQCHCYLRRSRHDRYIRYIHYIHIFVVDVVISSAVLCVPKLVLCTQGMTQNPRFIQHLSPH